MTTYATKAATKTKQVRKRKLAKAHVAVPKSVRRGIAKTQATQSVKGELEASRGAMTNREKRLTRANAMLDKRIQVQRRPKKKGPSGGPKGAGGGPGFEGPLRGPKLNLPKGGAQLSAAGKAEQKKREKKKADFITRAKTGKLSTHEKNALKSKLLEAGDRGKLSKSYYQQVAKGLGAKGPAADKLVEKKYAAAQKRKASYDKRINPHTGKHAGMEGQGMPGWHTDHKTGERWKADRMGKEIKGTRKKAKPLVFKQGPKKARPKVRPRPKGGRLISRLHREIAHKQRRRHPQKGYGPFHGGEGPGNGVRYRHPRRRRRRVYAR